VKQFKNIKTFYKPIQPSVKAKNKDIVYQEIKATKAIENFVYCFWQLKTIKNLNSPFIYRVVSDGCIDIFFDHNQPQENFIMGFCRKYTQFPIGQEFNYIGIRFLPTAFPLLFGINAKTLSNQSQDLKFVFPLFSQWINRHINMQQSFTSIIELLILD